MIYEYFELAFVFIFSIVNIIKFSRLFHIAYSVQELAS